VKFAGAVPSRRWQHLTYERIFHEHIEDLLGVCRKCHRELDQPNW